MRRLLTEPLLGFLLIGCALFVLFDLVSTDGEDQNDRLIVVDRETLLTFVQFRSRAFEPELAASRLDSLSDIERQRLIEDFVREEALYREARALAMDSNDYVIKQRMIQKVEFINSGFAAAAVELSTADIEAYYAANRDNYFVDPFVTFTHVFFDNERHGREQALALATAKLSELNASRVVFSASPQHGDRFLYHTNYVERDLSFVASHFGSVTAERIAALEPDMEGWHGPFESPYGFHLVMLTESEPGRYPELDEIAERVRDDARQERIRHSTEAAIEAIVSRYDVRLEIAPLPEPVARADAAGVP